MVERINGVMHMNENKNVDNTNKNANINKKDILKNWFKTNINRQNIVRILLALSGGILFGLFTNPFASGIINIGNITGTIIAVLMISYSIMFDVINNGIRKFVRRKYGRLAMFVAAVFSTVLVTTVVVTTILMITATTKIGDGTETLIVLGCKVNGESPCSMLEERLIAAKSYLEEHEEAVCIVSGGQGSDEGISEAECMYNWLVANGIDGARIYMEDQSTSTIENIKNSMEILENENLGTNVAIATNEFHVFRAGTVAESMGLTYSAVPAKTSWWLVPTYSVREMYGIVATALFEG